MIAIVETVSRGQAFQGPSSEPQALPEAQGSKRTQGLGDAEESDF
jgi:hypothetical protein